jgi:hypothetical protein
VTELFERVLKLLTAHRNAGKPLPGEAVREGRDLQLGHGETIAADACQAGRRPGHHEPTGARREAAGVERVDKAVRIDGKAPRGGAVARE